MSSSILSNTSIVVYANVSNNGDQNVSNFSTNFLLKAPLKFIVEDPATLAAGLTTDTADQADIAIDSFQNDFDKYAWIAIKPDIIASAQELLMTHGKRGLRTLDSIQLASILILKEEECTFITFDSNLKYISQAENLNVFG